MLKEWLLGLLGKATKAVPAVKYALGVAGVAAAVAIIAGFSVSYKVAVLGTIIMLALMFVLVIFASFARTPNASLKFLSFTLAGAFTFLIIGTSFFIFTGFFFSWPRPLDEIADRVTGSHAASPTPTPTPVAQPSPTPPPAPTQAPANANPSPPAREQPQSTPAPRRTTDYVGRARSLYAQGKYEEALSECDKALRVNPGNAEVAALKRRIARTLEILNRQ